MIDFTLYYWPLPFRGHFVRSILAHAGATWDEPDIDEVADLRTADPKDQRVPHMGPPVLTDNGSGLSISQTQAILMYLGDRFDLVPDSSAHRALTNKVIADANDVLYEMSRFNGSQLWNADAWEEYRPRLERWMVIYEALGRDCGLQETGGYLLGTEAPGIADFTAFSLWGVMTTQLPQLRSLLEDNAPAITSLCDRIGERPEQRELWERCLENHGEGWCGGQIENSLRAVV